MGMWYVIRACQLIIFVWTLFALDYNPAIPQYSAKWWALTIPTLTVIAGLEWLLRKKTKRRKENH
jgi:hypothetical protein